MPIIRHFGLTTLWSWLALLWLSSDLVSLNRTLWLSAAGFFVLGAGVAHLFLSKTRPSPPKPLMRIAAVTACAFSFTFSVGTFQDGFPIAFAAAALGVSTAVLRACWDADARPLSRLLLEKRYTTCLVLFAALLPFLLLVASSVPPGLPWAIAVASLPLVAAVQLSSCAKKGRGYAPDGHPSPQSGLKRPAPLSGRLPSHPIVLVCSTALAFGTCAALLELKAYPDPHPALALLPGIILAILFFVLCRLVTLGPATDETLRATLLVGTVVELCLLAPNDRNTLLLSLVVACMLWVLLDYLTLPAQRLPSCARGIAFSGNPRTSMLLGSCTGIGIAFAVRANPPVQQLLSLALIIAIALVFALAAKTSEPAESALGSALPASTAEPVRSPTSGDVAPGTVLALLTPREKEVVRYVQKGRSIPHICNALSISKSTAETHIRHIYEKAGVHSRQELLDILDEENAG